MVGSVLGILFDGTRTAPRAVCGTKLVESPLMLNPIHWDGMSTPARCLDDFGVHHSGTSTRVFQNMMLRLTT
jgi:hypothetical protein